jgi:hypothetical protein
MAEPTTYPEWIAALNTEAKRRGDSNTQPPHVMNPFYDAFPVSPQDDDWREHFRKRHTPAEALDAEGFVEWHRLPDAASAIVPVRRYPRRDGPTC